MRLLPAVLLALVTCWTAFGQNYTISTFAGGGLPVNIPGPTASLYGPTGIAVDKTGNIFFVNQSVVLRMSSTNQYLSLAAGNGTSGFSGDNGLAIGAQLAAPSGVAVDSAGNLYVADTYNNCIRKIANGVISTVAGSGAAGFYGDNGLATVAQLSAPFGVAVDSAGILYIADSGNQRIRKVSNGVITTVAGSGAQGFGGDNGPAIGAQLYNPKGLAVDSDNNLYIADTANNRIRKVVGGVITTVAGNGTSGFSGDKGPATSAQLASPVAVAVDATGSVYFSDTANSRIRKVSGGVIATVAGGGVGADGPAASAALGAPYGIAISVTGDVYIADTQNNSILKISSGVISTMAGNGSFGINGDNGVATSAQLNLPYSLAVDSANSVYLTDFYNGRIREITTGVIATVAGGGPFGDNGPATSALLNYPTGVAVDSAHNLYIADIGNNRVRKVSGGVITTVAGGNGALGSSGGFSGDGGPATGAQLNGPWSVAVDSAGNLYISDQLNNRIRKVAGGMITTVAGNGSAGFSGDNGPAINAQLNRPTGVAVDSFNNLYLADNNRIRKVSNGVITTVAGGGVSLGDNGPATGAQLKGPTGIAVDSASNLYIADIGNNRIRKVSNGVITTIAGGGFSLGDNGPATSAQLSEPYGIAVDVAGNIYVSDAFTNRVRLLTPGTKPTIAENGLVPIYSSVPVIQTGSWVSIYGSDLADGTSIWSGDFPKSLGGTTVTIDNKPASLWVVSPTQINLQVPDDVATGLVSVAVTTASGTAASTVTLSPYGPSFSLLGDGKHVAAEILTSNGKGVFGGGTYDLVGPSNTFSYSTRPVKAGETLVLYGVGFGPTTPAVLAGKIFSGSAPTNNKVAITIGGVAANVSYSGITSAGLYQINLTVPPNTGIGDQPLQATVNGVQTPLGPVVAVQ